MSTTTTSKKNKKWIILAITTLIIGFGFYERIYIIALYKTLTFEKVKVGDKFYATSKFINYPGILDIPVYRLIRPKTVQEIDAMNITAQKKEDLKRKVSKLRGLKNSYSGLSFTNKKLLKQGTAYLGDCIRMVSVEKETMSEIKLNMKNVDDKFFGPDDIPETYVLADNRYYIYSYHLFMYAEEP